MPGLTPSGGIDVAIGHAVRLEADHGAACELVLTERGRPARSLPVAVRSLAEARGQRYDLALATWWQTASALGQLRAARHAVLLQSFEQRFYREDAPFEALGAEMVLSLPAAFIVVAPWMRELLFELRPDVGCAVVPNGIDKAIFTAPARTAERTGPLRVLIEGQPDLWFKGVQSAVSAVAQMSEPAEVTLLAPSLGDYAPGPAVARVVGGLDAAGVAAVYRETDVILKLSRVESLGLAPLEAFHAGVPCVVTPYTGHEEYVVHGVNGLVVGFDDVPATSRALDLLARDRVLLDRLSHGASETARGWPTPSRSTELLASELQAIIERPAPAGDLSLQSSTLALHAELGREALRAGAARLRTTEGVVAQREAELAAIRAKRSYRAARALRRALARGPSA